MRQYSEITIYSVLGSSSNKTVPITPASKRRWRLMEEDSLTLVFDDKDSLVFNIGDYVNDEIFGKFLITEEQAPPEYDISTGAYRYELRFDREYIGFKNYVFMLTYGTTRRETEWTLTDKLSVHLDEIIRNLSILGFSYTYQIDVEGSEKAATVTYSGTDIYSALRTLCETYKCEFWVVGNVIHLGKCEVNETIDFTVSNTESITPSRNDNDYANRLYVFGSTKNIPDTYRKELIFKVTEKQDTETNISLTWTSNREIKNGSLVSSTTFSVSQSISVSTYNRITLTRPSYACMVFGYSNGTYHEINSDSGNLIDDYDVSSESSIRIQALTSERGLVSCVGKTDGVYFRDSSRILRPNMIVGASDDHELTLTQNNLDFSQTVTLKSGGYNLRGKFTVRFHCTRVPANFGTASIKAYVGTALLKTTDYSLQNGTDTRWTGFYPLEFTIDEDTTVSAGNKEVKISVTLSTTQNVQYADFTSDLSLNSMGLAVNMAIVTTSSRNVVYNEPLDYGGWFKMSSGTIDIGTEFTIDEQYLVLTQIPSAYYTDTEGDPNSLRLLGERRLMLPEGTAYIGDSLPTDRLVEKVVIFEDIYPKCALRITSITEKEKTIEKEYSDGSSSKNTYTEFTIAAKRITSAGDVDFPFSKEYLTPDPLQLKFISQDEERKYSDGVPHGKVNGYLLTGMTFDLQWNQTDSTYTIVYNNDYGAQLPNTILRPKVGDPFILIGWNTKAMPALGLISAAESELATAGALYLQAIEDSSYTFECGMMSDWANTNGVLDFGQKVKVDRGDLEKESRVIGYELNLDIPYDTPRYTIGETEAYSALRNLQDKLNAVVMSGSSSGGVVVNNYGGTSSSTTPTGGAASLADLDDVDMEGIQAGDYLIWDSVRGMMVADSNRGQFFQLNSSRQTLVELLPDYEFLGPRKGLIFDAQSTEIATNPPDLYVRTVDGQRVLYSPLPLITGGDQIVIDGTPGGGGGGTGGFLYELGDIYHKNAQSEDVQYVAHADGSRPDAGDVLTYNATKGWLAAPSSGGSGTVTSVSLAEGATNGTIHIVVDGTAQSDVAVHGLGTMAYETASNYQSKYPFTISGTSGTTYNLANFLTSAVTSIGGKSGVITLSGGLSINSSNVLSSADTKYKLTLNGTTNGDNSGTSLGTLYAPTTLSGSTYVLIGGSSAPAWTLISGLSVGTASKLSTVSKTAWGQTYWTSGGVPDSVSGDMSSVGNVTPSANKSKNLGSSSALWAKVYSDKYYLTDTIYFYTETVNNVVCVHLNAPFITDGDQIVMSGTPGGGGTGGAGFLYELGDIYHDDAKTKVLRADGSDRAAGDLLSYTTAHGWVALDPSTIAGTTYTAGTGISISNANVISVTANTYAPYNSAGYLPLSAGSTKALTGALYISSGSVYDLYINNTSTNADTVGIRFQVGGTTIGELYTRTSDNQLVWNGGSNGAKVIYHTGNLTLSNGAITIGSNTITPVTDVTYDSTSDRIQVTKGGSASNVLVGFATTSKRFARYVGTNEAGGYDLNTLLTGGGITSQYGSSTYWANQPTGMTYGGVVQLNTQASDSLCMQFAWDVVHTSSTVGDTGKLWWRDKPTAGWGTWHLIYDSASLTKSVVTGLLGNEYHPYGGATGIPFLASTIGANGNITITGSDRALNMGEAGSEKQVIRLVSSLYLLLGSGTYDTLPTILYGTPIRFYTYYNSAGGERMRILADGTLLIGATSLPSGITAKLYVNGATYLNGNATIPTGSTLTIGGATISWVASGNSGYLKINTALLTEGDQIVNSGTPGGGGGGTIPYLYELQDVTITNIGTGNLLQWNGSAWVNVAASSVGVTTVATTQALGLVKSTTTGTTANRTYNVEVNTDGTMKVNVPWENNTYSLLTSSANGLAPAFSTANKATSASTNSYYFLGWTGSTMKWYTLPANAFSDTTYAAATQSAAGLMSSTDKTKLDGIATGATAVTDSTVSGWGYLKTDEKVKQTATTTSAAYEILFSESANNTTTTEGARKTSTLTYNPSTKALSTGGAVNGLTLTAATTGFTIAGGSTTSKTLTVSNTYTLGDACAKGYTDSSSASAISTGTSLVTERDVYYGLPTINNAHNYTSSTTIYAPTGAGTSGYWLKAAGGTSAPTWEATSNLEAGKATTTADTTNALYVVGVTSGATSTLKRDTSVTITGGAVSATSLTLAGALSGATTGSFSSDVTISGVLALGTSSSAALNFQRGSANYITAPASGYFCFVPNGGATSIATSSLVVNDTSVYSGINTVTLGTTSYPWQYGYFANAIYLTRAGVYNSIVTSGRNSGLRVYTTADADDASAAVAFQIDGAKNARCYGSFVRDGYDVHSREDARVYVWNASTSNASIAMRIYKGNYFQIGSGTYTTIPTIIYGSVLRFYTYDSAGAERMRITADGKVGIGTTSPSQALHVAGTILSTGDQVVSSDATLKKDWRPLNYGISDIAKATAGVFTWKDGKGISAGTKAQDWEKLVPQLVHGEEGHKSLAYGQIAMLNTILLARGYESHEERIKRLEAENMELKKEIERLRMN